MADNLSAGFLSRLRNLTEAQLVDLCFKMAERHNDTFVEIVLAIPERDALPVSRSKLMLQASHRMTSSSVCSSCVTTTMLRR